MTSLDMQLCWCSWQKFCCAHIPHACTSIELLALCCGFCVLHLAHGCMLVDTIRTAEIIASRMDKGSNVVCIGTQETSSWVDHQGQKRYMTKYKLSAWSIQRPSQDANRAQRPAPSGDSQPRAMPSRTYESAYGAPASRPSQPGSHVAQEVLRDEYQSAATPPQRIQDAPEHGDDPILM